MTHDAALSPFDAADYLSEPEDVIAFLNLALEDDDPKMVAKAIGIAARSQGGTQIAQRAGIPRQTLYGAFTENGNPSLSTIMRTLHALGLRLSVQSLPEG